MTKYYTRACNFYYGFNARSLIKKRLALPLCGNKNIAFDKIEVLVKYENIVLNFDDEIKKTLNYLNLDFEINMKNFFGGK